MRTLKLNKTKLWLVKCTGTIEKKDDDGFYTGEIIKTYGKPIVVYLALYPSDGMISEQIFGKDNSLDMICVTNEVIINEFDLLFKTEPTDGNVTKTYDYSVSSIKNSLNTFQYGLRSRT